MGFAMKGPQVWVALFSAKWIAWSGITLEQFFFALTAAMNRQKAESFIGGYNASNNGITRAREMGDRPFQLCDRVLAEQVAFAFEVNSSLRGTCRSLP